MGLDIRLDVSPWRVSDECSDATLKQAFNAAAERLDLPYSETIHTQPGSYHGLHRLRRAYAQSRGMTPADGCEWEQSQAAADLHSHLVSHSDADGYYIPDDLNGPSHWLPGAATKFHAGHFVSVGSSQRLLAELQSFDPVAFGVHEEWDAVFVVAVASVVCRRVLYFT